jgi:hypothetical protein
MSDGCLAFGTWLGRRLDEICGGSVVDPCRRRSSQLGLVSRAIVVVAAYDLALRARRSSARTPDQARPFGVSTLATACALEQGLDSTANALQELMLDESFSLEFAPRYLEVCLQQQHHSGVDQKQTVLAIAT